MRCRLVLESVSMTAFLGLFRVMSHEVAICIADNSALTMHEPSCNLHLDLAVLTGS